MTNELDDGLDNWQEIGGYGGHPQVGEAALGLPRDGADQPMGAGGQRMTMCTIYGTLSRRTSPEEDRCGVLSDVGRH
jgi:hypothetical protein